MNGKKHGERPISILFIISKILGFSIGSISFLMTTPFFLNTNLVFGQRTQLLPRLFSTHTIFLHKLKAQFGITNAELDWFGIISTPKKCRYGINLSDYLDKIVCQLSLLWFCERA